MSRRRGVRRAVLGSGLLAAAAGCTLLTSLDDYASSPVDAGGAPFDAAAEASADVDAFVPVADGGDGGRYCTGLFPTPLFCDDFDDEGPFQVWSSKVVTPDASLGKDDAAARSAPYSLRSATTGATKQGAALVALVPISPATRIHVGYDLRIDVRGDYAEIGYIKFVRAPPATSFSFYLRVRGSPGATLTAEGYLADGGVPALNVDLAGAPSFAEWTHLDLDVDLSARTAKVRVAGVQAASITLPTELYGPGTADVRAGIGYSDADGKPWAINVDNFTADWQ